MEAFFITGASGFVGTNLARYFSQKGIAVYGHSRKSETAADRAKFLREYSSAVLNQLNVSTFIHLAAIAHDLNGLYKPEDYYHVNLEGTKKAVDIFLQSEATHFIFVSSIKAACDAATTSVDESIIPLPQTDYGKSKLLAEEYIQSLQWPPEKKFYILRPCMMHGPGNKGNLNLLYQYAKSGLPFLFGAFDNKRSFHSIENFNFAIEKLILRNCASGIYHLADDDYLSTSQLYELICDTLGKKARIWNLSPTWIEFMSSVAGKRNMISKLTEDMLVSNKKIKDAIGEPFPISLKDGLRKTIDAFNGR